MQNNGAVQIAAEKELDFGCPPTPGSNNTIAGVERRTTGETQEVRDPRTFGIVHLAPFDPEYNPWTSC